MQGTFRLAIINTPADVSALRFRGWLRTEIAQVQEPCKVDDIAVVRLFMPERLRVQVTQSKLDRLLGDLVDRFPNIYRIELRPVDQPLTPDQLLQERTLANEDMESFVAQLKEGHLPDSPTNKAK